MLKYALVLAPLLLSGPAIAAADATAAPAAAPSPAPISVDPNLVNGKIAQQLGEMFILLTQQQALIAGQAGEIERLNKEILGLKATPKK